MTMIRVENLSKQFATKKLFSDLSFSIHKGEVVALVGPSGCGKSTLLNMVGLLEPIEEGVIKIDGQSLPTVNSRKAVYYRRHRINYLFQSNALIQTASVWDNLILALRFDKHSQPTKRQKIEEALAFVYLKDKLEAKVNTLSGGEQERVAIARAILKPGDILLADEPTGALDPKLAQESFERIVALRDNYGKTLLLVTHNIEQAKQCDRIIYLG
ncbi:ATP-binding cassette domain-containing protein [Streptococcus sp. zg-JUN1979]|uniref:ATP-binding cassette domain-containing protein n=1 Tax=Streptococcus sp. zg-JUN1979 TaxID=3391450 RepID=UPI0039A5A3F5